MWNWRSILGLTPYIVGAALIALALTYYTRPLAAGLGATQAIQIEAPSTARMVDRTHKGDRLPVDPNIAVSGDRGGEPAASRAVPRNVPRPPGRRAIPEGCDSAFGPLVTAEQGNFAARCVM